MSLSRSRVRFWIFRGLSSGAQYLSLIFTLLILLSGCMVMDPRCE